MALSKELQQHLAEYVYAGLRETLIIAAPDMVTWEALTTEQQEQVASAMRMWFMGIGSNEVLEEWFRRSGQLPKAIWEQVPDGPDRIIFSHAAYGLLLLQLVKLAEKGLQAEQKA